MPACQMSYEEFKNVEGVSVERSLVPGQALCVQVEINHKATFNKK
jgi:hypothetical protein